MTPIPSSFTFVRHLDGLVYHFVRDGERHGRPAYRRVDGQVWCVWDPGDGWRCEGSDGVANSRPLHGGDGDDLAPPATTWRSFKADRSYLYELRYEVD